MEKYIIFQEVSSGIYRVLESTYTLAEGIFVNTDTVMMYLNDGFYKDVSIVDNKKQWLFKKIN